MPGSFIQSIEFGKRSFIVASLSDPRLVALEKFEYNISQGNWAEVQLALEHGANPNQITQEGMPVIMLAVVKKHSNIVIMLLDYGAKISCSYQSLSLCAQVMIAECTEILELLLSRGADPNQQHNGIPLLLLAIKIGNVSNVQLLLEYGADPNSSITLKNKSNTALKCAVAAGAVEVVAMLFRAGADIHAAGEDELLLLAIAINNVDMMSVMLKQYSKEMFLAPIQMNVVFNRYPQIKDILKRYREKIYGYLIQFLQTEKKSIDRDIERLDYSATERGIVLADRLEQILRNMACPCHQLFFLESCSSKLFKLTIMNEKIEAQLKGWIKVFKTGQVAEARVC